MRAIVFPGQGVHGPGMGAWLYAEQRAIFDEASDALNIDVAELCRSGTAGQASLDSTKWAQPAILVAGVAAHRALVERGNTFDVMSGHSLGEYSALVAAGALSLGDGVRLVSLRADAMDRAGRRNPGSMAALIGTDRATADELCRLSGAVVAGDNTPAQIVVSGTLLALDTLMLAAKGAGVRCQRLNVAGAFHSPCMADALPTVGAVIDVVPLRQTAVTVWSPTLVETLRDDAQIRRALLDQLTRPVLWRQTVIGMIESGVASFVDAGPQKVLANMIRRIDPNATVQTAEEVSRADWVASP